LPSTSPSSAPPTFVARVLGRFARGTIRSSIGCQQVVAAVDSAGDGTRRAILECLAEQPCAVGEIAARLPVSRPAVSQHLKVLKASGLVSDEAVGTRHIYRLNEAGVSA